MLATMSTPLPRRALLRLAGTGVPAGLLLTVAGCTEETAPPPPDPDRVALEGALDVEVALYLTVGNLKATGPTALIPVHTVQTHIQTLDDALGQEPSVTAELATAGTPSPGPSGSASASGADTPPTTAPTTVADAVRAADRAADLHTRALHTASPAISPLLASLAASDAALAASLRGSR
jgi:hypothetical protein